MIEIPPQVTRAVRTLRKHNHQAFLVGGAVRDMLRMQIPKDWDIATNAKPNQIESIFPHSIPTGKAFGTITVLINRLPIQVTTYRVEHAYIKHRKPLGVIFTQELEADLSRRDFTVNAIALDPLSGAVVDPFGGGHDIKNRILRTVGRAEKRFDEDALRIIRAARFLAQLSFHADRQLVAGARKMRKLVPLLSKERIRDEIAKLLISPIPSVGLLWLDQARILDLLFPDLAKCKHVRQGGWHRYDVFRHTLKAVDSGPRNLELRLALLLHDIAKPKTRTRDRHGYHFYKHDQIGAEMAADILHNLRFSNDTRKKVVALIRHHLFEDKAISQSDSAVRRLMRRVGEEYIEDLLLFRRADIRGCGPDRRPSASLVQILRRVNKIRKADQALRITDLAVNGLDVMKWLNLSPGPVVGQILKELLEEVITHPGKNKKSELRKLVLKFHNH